MFSDLVEVLAEAVTIRDRDGDIVYANRAALAYLELASSSELRQRTSRSIMDEWIVEDEHGRELTMDDVPSIRLMSERDVPPLLMRIVHRRNGELRWCLLKATAVRDEHGGYLGAMTVIEDVTAVKLAEVHTRVLAESGRRLASTLDYEQTLRHVTEVAVPALVDYCSVDLLDDRGWLERVATRHRELARQATAMQLATLPPGRLGPNHPVARVLLTGASELYREVRDEDLVAIARDDRQLRLLRELGLRSLVLVPLRVPGRTIGAMALATAKSLRRLDSADVELAEQLGRRAAVAVENARLHTKLAGVAAMLQRDLLPDELPAIDGWELAALYRPAGGAQRIDVGGDFYEFFEHEGVWFAIIGDVTGRGVAAASVTTLMRHGARVACRAGPSPSAILSTLDGALREHAGDALCTAICLCLREGELEICSAGHPPAIIARADGTLQEAPPPGPLLGAFANVEWRAQTVRVSPDDLVVLYTDGVTETRGADERFGIARLCELLREHRDQGPQALLAELDRALDAFTHGEQRDDIAVLAMRSA